MNNKVIVSKNSSLFHHFSKGKDHLSVNETRNFLITQGFLLDDPRWTTCYEHLTTLEKVDEESFNKIFCQRLGDLSKAALNELIIPEFSEFCEEIDNIFYEAKKNKEGNNAEYIPQLARVDPEKFGISLCTIDGQRFNLGDYEEDFSIQSTSKPIAYAIAVETEGEEYVHNHVDREPSGQAFNAMALTPDKIPYNPMVNSGAIMVASLIERESESSKRFESVLKWYKRLAGGLKPGFCNSVYLSEKMTADKNFSLAYMMKSVGSFPKGVDISSTLEFYFQCCSIEMNCKSMSVIASTLANGGICPLTHERVLSTKTTRAVLSLMFSCGMYDYSGQFAFTVGLPAKSGVSGIIMLVVPGVAGFAIWSPRLDKYGNSVRGIDFCNKLTEKFNFHNFDNLLNGDDVSKKDPRKKSKTSKQKVITEFLYGCMENDANTIKRMIMSGVDVNLMDYDRRTGLHIAASEGFEEIIELLVKHGADASIKDRWNSTPIDDAIRLNKIKIADILTESLKAKKSRTNSDTEVNQK